MIDAAKNIRRHFDGVTRNLITMTYLIARRLDFNRTHLQ
jgi:hypothetical protein